MDREYTQVMGAAMPDRVNSAPSVRQDVNSLTSRLAALGDEISEFVHMARNSADSLFGYENQNQTAKVLPDKEVCSAHDLLDRCFELTNALRSQLNRF